MVLPPGTLLQLMYLQERIRLIVPGRFIEIGPGSGEITKLLLDHGWSGYAYDLEEKTVAALKERFANEVAIRSLTPIHDSFHSATLPNSEKVDLIISSMVMEHLEDGEQITFMQRASERLKLGGMLIGLVPASPADWGIEDDIAGHYRRYTKESITSLMASTGWKVQHMAALTFPVSNLLLPISNFLVNRSERSKLTLSPLERTKQSGQRQVKFKTYFPAMLGLLLNKITLFPLHLLQKMFTKSDHALVLYFEAYLSPGANKK
ncbi:bifunctional 2-polyprenyl-6-hydroxyphenol methylase/3-demethylubiquinol 3-O-methyltransferase UbiG [Polynucleobacter sp. MWH-HuK1]|uniref:class I SAM-dependent methyltransferase n=1 Tax=Polynucleobacter sp. MWH-HuK1 TaxID=1743158 RepID=UPI001C0B7AF0|nr:class I SAM-dependent methyltransferase [Polynucleobacter sp. MWH-HuK1]MBU3564432.1 class I SAM-dependent methyltransferase [Polynucleobacter sp. MWH-HuK1]